MNKKWIQLLLILIINLTACGKQDSKHEVKVAATSIPHAEILEFVKKDLKDNDIDLEVIVVEDYNTPNRALNDKEIDANFFQHKPFLEMQIQDFGYNLDSLTSIHLEPMGVYSKKIKKIEDLKKGALIAVPSDPSNQARALCLLEHKGLIKLKRCDTKTTILDITENPHFFKWVEIDSPLLTRALEDVDAAAITTNFALQAGLLPLKDALIIEDNHSLYSNILVIRKGEESRQDLQKLKEILTSNKVKFFMQEHYQGAIIPTF